MAKSAAAKSKPVQPGMATTSGKSLDIFAKAKGKTAEAPTKVSKKPETVWAIKPLVQDEPTADQLDAAITELLKLKADRAALETREKAYKAMLKEFGIEQYTTYMADQGVEPPAPLRITNSQGESVTFVTQDRGHLTSVTDEQMSALAELLGEKQAEELVWTGGTFAFDPTVLAQDGVMEKVQVAVSQALQGAGLTKAQLESILVYEEKRRFKPGLVARASEIAGKTKERIATFLDLLAGAFVSYVKP